MVRRTAARPAAGTEAPASMSKPLDHIRLLDLTLFPRLGVTEWEKEGVQKVSVDVDLGHDASAAAREDRIGAAVDYSAVYALCQEVAKERKYHLIEALAQALADRVLASFPSVQEVRVKLRKRNLPFDAHLDCVEIDLLRERGGGR